MPYIFALLVLLSVGYALHRHAKTAARQTLLSQPLTSEERAIIADEVPLTRQLPDNLRAGFEGKINLFLEQVEVIGCNGFEVTDRVRLSIAAQACMIVANTDAWYRTLRTVLVYPGAFKSRQTRHEGFVVSEEEVIRAGESWANGPVVLSWEHSHRGARDATDGHNVVFHEFAHQLDAVNGAANGVPVFSKGQTFAEWESVILDAFDRHQAAVERGRTTVIDAYGAQNHEEFFAVAIEIFLERPHDLRNAEPMVYDQLSRLLQLDPANWRTEDLR